MFGYCQGRQLCTATMSGDLKKHRLRWPIYARFANFHPVIAAPSRREADFFISLMSAIGD